MASRSFALCLGAFMFFTAWCGAQGHGGGPAHEVGYSFEERPSDTLASISHSVNASFQTGRWREFALRTKVQGVRRQIQSLAIVPSDLYEAGVSLRAQGADRWGEVKVRSRSDEPFHSMREMEYEATAGYLNSRSERSTWLFGLNFNSQRVFWQGIPLPFAAYQYAGDTFQVTVGAPFFRGAWQILPGLSLNGSYFYVNSTKISADYQAAPDLTVSARYRTSQNYYLLAGRNTKEDRLFEDFSEIGLGLDKTLNPKFSVQVFLGYTFNVSYFISEDLTGTKDNTQDVANSEFLRLGLKYGF